MYKEPYNSRISLRMSNEIKETNKLIEEEKKKGEVDKHKIMRLYEQRLMQGAMLNQFDGVYGKYQNPW